MFKTTWLRLSAPLIEVSLTSSEAPTDARRWELRLEGNTLTLKLFPDNGDPYDAETIEITRENREITAVKIRDQTFEIVR